MYAVKQKKPKSVNFLTGQKSNDLNEEDNHTMTILMHTMEESNTLMARKLLKRGADINYVNSNGCTALHMCVKMNLRASCVFLLE